MRRLWVSPSLPTVFAAPHGYPCLAIVQLAVVFKLASAVLHVDTILL